MKRAIFRPAAAADVEDAHDWYEGQRPDLGREFLHAIAETLATVLENPELYPVIHRSTRRALLRRFPYGLYYRVVDQQVIVVACMHASRDPRRWMARG